MPIYKELLSQGRELPHRNSKLWCNESLLECIKHAVPSLNTGYKTDYPQVLLITEGSTLQFVQQSVFIRSESCHSVSELRVLQLIRSLLNNRNVVLSDSLVYWRKIDWTFGEIFILLSFLRVQWRDGCNCLNLWGKYKATARSPLARISIKTGSRGENS